MLGSSGHDSQSLEVVGTDGCAAELARLASGMTIDGPVSNCDSNKAYDFDIVPVTSGRDQFNDLGTSIW
jgi:hypothetical protein